MIVILTGRLEPRSEVRPTILETNNNCLKTIWIQDIKLVFDEGVGIYFIQQHLFRNLIKRYTTHLRFIFLQSLQHVIVLSTNNPTQQEMHEEAEPIQLTLANGNSNLSTDTPIAYV